MTTLHLRWTIRRDMPSVLAIEDLSFEYPWSEEDFIRCIRQRNCIGYSALIDDDVLGYMVYELHKNRLHLLNFAVHPSVRRLKVGTAMVEKLQSKLSAERRNRLMLEVRETNLTAQLFFRSLGFRAVGVLREYYDDCDEDAYLMEYRHRERVC